MALRQRIKSALPDIRKLMIHGKLTETQLKELFNNAFDIMNNIDLQNADYDELIWAKMVQGDGGQDFTPDELPESSGEFGREINNPIPVNGATGEVTYLSRLIYDDGNKSQCIVFHRLGSKMSPQIGRYIDIFEILSIDGLYYDKLYLDMYHVEQSKKAPVGYRLCEKLTGITGESIAPNENFPENTLERAFEYAIDIFGAPVVNPALYELDIVAGRGTIDKHRIIDFSEQI